MDEHEEWRAVPGFERYEVSSLGRVRGPHGPRKLNVHKKGYAKVGLYAAGRPRPTNVMVHAIVLAAFVGPLPPGHESRHLNDIKTDNRLSNLCYGTVRENVADAERHGLRPRYHGERNGQARLTVEAVRELRAHPGDMDVVLDVVVRHGVTVETAVKAQRGLSWRHVA